MSPWEWLKESCPVPRWTLILLWFCTVSWDLHVLSNWAHGHA